MSIAALSKDTVVARLEVLERRVGDLEKQLAAMSGAGGTGTADLPAAVRTLRELFEYTILKPVDIVKLDGDPYFWYTKDFTYGLFSEHKPDTFIRNHRLTDEDLRPPVAYEFSIAEFLEGRHREFPRHEHFAKLLICAHLWAHDMDFTLLDIGANVGYSSVPCAKFFKRFGRTNCIYAFEPGLAGDLLKANIELNRVDDLVHLDDRAVSDRCGPVVMNSVLGHSACDSLHNFRKYYKELVPAVTRLVRTVTIDEFVREKKITNTLVLKIDAEGHDWPVLQGGRETFGRGQVAATLVEFVPQYIKEFIEPAQMLIDLARDHHLLYILELRTGYHWKGHALPQEPDALREFARQVHRSPLTFTDIVAVSKRLPAAQTLVQRLCE